MGRIFRAFIDNLTSLLLALILAVIIWAAAVREANPDTERFFELPINAVQPDDVILLNTPADRVSVTFTGPENLLETLDPLGMQAILDLSTLTTAGRETIDIQLISADPIDENIQVALSPAQVVVDIDFETTRTIPVMVNVQGNLPLTHSLGDVTVVPEEIEVTGPQSRVAELLNARTTIFLTNNTQQTFAETRRLTIYDRDDEPVGTTDGTLVFGTTQATITAEIIENESIADVTIQVTLEGLPAQGYRLLNATAEPRSILLQGPPELLDDLSFVRTTPVPITGLNSSALFPVTVELPEGIDQLNDTSVVVNVDIDRIMTTGVFEVAPTTVGLSPELTTTVPITSVRVTLFGPLDTLDALSADDIRVELPLNDVEEGTNIVVPVVTPPELDDIEVRSFFPSLITMIVTRTVTESETLPESSFRTVPHSSRGRLWIVNTLPIADLPRTYTLHRL